MATCAAHDPHLGRPFHDLDKRVRGNLAEALNRSVRPSHFNRINCRSHPEPKVQPSVALRQVAVTASPLSTLDEIAGANGHDRANGAPIAVAFEIDHQEILTIPTVVPEYRWRTIQVVHDEIQISVVIEIRDRGSPADGPGAQRGA